MQDKIILGILTKANHTAYEIIKIMKKYINLFYSGSMGSIHPVLKKLQKKNFVTVKEKATGGRLKKIYAITKEGRSSFQSWFYEEITIKKIQDEAALRIFFFSDTPKDVQIRSIKNYIIKLKEKLQSLQDVEKEIKHSNFDSTNKKAIFFMGKTLHLGLHYYNLLIKWYEDFVKFLEKGA